MSCVHILFDTPNMPYEHETSALQKNKYIKVKVRIFKVD